MKNKLEQLKNYFLYRSHTFVMINIIVTAVYLLFRLTEIILVGISHELPPNINQLIFSAVLVDLSFLSIVFLLLSFLYLLLYQLHHRLAEIIHMIFVSLLLFANIGLAKYFSITFIPLSSDFYGYSWNDIQETIAASGGITFLTVVLLLFIIGSLIAIPFIAKKMPNPKFLVIAFFVFCVVSPVLYSISDPDPSTYKKESEYFLVSNKTSYFIQKSYQYFKGTLFHQTAHSSLEYPLMKDADYTDVLGQYFIRRDQKPNLVFIVAEGLGASFVNDGTYAGFMPFVDSLSHRSLYWKNFLSTSGRTFGVMPALFGSLPYGERGFMEMGDTMPNHLSLVKLLNENGYNTTFFYGGERGFDKMDVFFDRQQITRIVDVDGFDSRYKKSESTESGFTWGFADKDVFKHSFEVIDQQMDKPRLDIYLTLSTHEPFLPPSKEYYVKTFGDKLRSMEMKNEKKERMAKYSLEFSSLIYLDDALRYFFSEYSKRADYSRTIFIVTGDHRMIPIPADTKIDRFHVPFIIFSPMLKQPREFHSVSSHLDVVPTLSAFFKQNYNMKFPSSVHWLGTGIDTAQEFRNIHSLPFMRVKNEINNYLDGEYFLDDQQLFKLYSTMNIEVVADENRKMSLQKKLDDFKILNMYVSSNNKIYPFVDQKNVNTESLNADSKIAPLSDLDLNSEQMFDSARHKAYAGKFEESRIICKKLLVSNPDYHDVRALLGRTYSWQYQYDDAREVFRDLIKRAPKYSDGYAGLAQIELWTKNYDTALTAINIAVTLSPNNLDDQLIKAKVIAKLGDNEEAKNIVKDILRRNPSMNEAIEFQKLIIAK